MSSLAGAALLAKIALTMSSSKAGRVTRFLTLAQEWDMREISFDAPSTSTNMSTQDEAILERDNTNRRGAFARRVNTVPLSDDIWSGSERHLWDVYGDLLSEGAIILADIPASEA